MLTDTLHTLTRELDRELNNIVGDFIVGERFTLDDYVTNLDEGQFNWEHPDSLWKIRFTPDHKVYAEYSGYTPTNYSWYFVPPILTELIVLDITEFLELQL